MFFAARDMSLMESFAARGTSLVDRVESFMRDTMTKEIQASESNITIQMTDMQGAIIRADQGQRLTDLCDAPHQVHHLLPKCCGRNNEPTNLASFVYSPHLILHVILATFLNKHRGLQYCVHIMSGGVLDPFRMLASPELLAADDEAVALAAQVSSKKQVDLASKGQHSSQNPANQSAGGAPVNSKDATRCQMCFLVHTVVNKATKKQPNGSSKIKNRILHTSRHQANLIPQTNLCNIDMMTTISLQGICTRDPENCGSAGAATDKAVNGRMATQVFLSAPD